jgi:hypothetical protein
MSNRPAAPKATLGFVRLRCPQYLALGASEARTVPRYTWS